MSEAIGVRFMAAVRSAEADPACKRGADLLSAVCVRLLPVDHAAIMVCVGGSEWEMLGASDDTAADWAQIQVAAAEGPGPQAYRIDAPVLVPDFGAALAGDRWPLLAASGLGRREGAVFSFPLRRGAIRVGTLDLYRDAPATLDRAGFATAVQVSDVVTVVLLAAVRTPERNGTRLHSHEEGLGSWWEVAVSTREIHQATGVVAAQLGVDIATAYARLIARALAEERPVVEFAADIVARRIRFDPGSTEPGRSRP
ncbi:ANTAR domain-containing protein [Nocardia sp. NPDC048505]|uniref:ANTAR domain-containing protein n=1 Tax=unclassified Nocardia TaxID=2637762 RepID=UPI0033E9A999